MQKPTSGLFSSAVFSEISAARDAKTVPFHCLLGWHEQVYLQIFSIIALAFAIHQCAHVYTTPFPFRVSLHLYCVMAE